MGNRDFNALGAKRMTVQPTEMYADLNREEVPPTAEAEGDLLGLVYQTGILDDKRVSPRLKVRVSVPTVPVDNNGNPVGAPFVAESRNISATGICLVHSQRIAAKYLMVELPGPTQERQKVAVEVLRCVAAHDGFEVAGPFVNLG
jgi:hypothetical protein